MSKQPKGIKGTKRQLRTMQTISRIEIKRAMKAASEAIDHQSQENQALRRIIISERAQVIYYAEKYQAHVARECLELVAKGFLDLSEEQQEVYVKRAIQELNVGGEIGAHDADSAAVGEESAKLGKKIIQ